MEGPDGGGERRVGVGAEKGSAFEVEPVERFGNGEEL